MEFRIINRNVLNRRFRRSGLDHNIDHAQIQGLAGIMIKSDVLQAH